MVHLMWILLSFILPIRVAFFFSVVVMLPLYTCEFIMIYGAKIKYLGTKSAFTKYGVYFNQEDMKYPMLE
jgi:hypothetical protein